MTAPLSPQEAATVERFETFTPAPESLRERVAQEMHNAACCEGCVRGPEETHRVMADAAIAVMRGEQP